MKILYDYQTFYNQNFGGISRYFFELINYCQHDNQVQCILPIQYSSNLYLKMLPVFTQNQLLPKQTDTERLDAFLNGVTFRGKGKIYSFVKKIKNTPADVQLQRNKELSIAKLKEGDFDVFHPTYYDNYFLDYIGDKPFVMTVYDMIHQIFPEYFLSDALDKSKEVLERAANIIAISECTKRDLVTIFGIDEEKVKVTYLANSLNAAAEDTWFVNDLPENYLLFVGQRGAYKNFYFFLQAFAVLSREMDDLSVVCTGTPFTEEEKFFFQKLGVDGKIFHHYIDDEKLACLYKNAAAFVFPSMYEGFGIPVLEAFACGCPVIISDGGSLPEIGRQAVLKFSSKEIGDLVSVLKECLLNSDLKDNLVKMGYTRLADFSWRNTAVETKRIYQNLKLK